jgi:cell filamentation protein
VTNGDPYVYPGSGVLRNRLGLTTSEALDVIERQLVTERASEGAPAGDFDLAHLQAIHRHLFQDIFDWAGELRTVEISKDGHQFQFVRFVATGMADVHRRIVTSDYLRGLPVTAFSTQAGVLLGDVNYVHPFRDGNGRTQLQYLRQLADRAGHALDLSLIDSSTWIAASRAAHVGDYAPMAAEIARVVRG